MAPSQEHPRQDHLPLISTGRNLAHGHDLHDAYQGFCCFHGLMRHLSQCLYMHCLRNLLARSLGSSKALLSLILPDSHVRQCTPGSNECCKIFVLGPSQLLCHDVHGVRQSDRQCYSASRLLNSHYSARTTVLLSQSARTTVLLSQSAYILVFAQLLLQPRQLRMLSFTAVFY